MACSIKCIKPLPPPMSTYDQGRKRPRSSPSPPQRRCRPRTQLYVPQPDHRSEADRVKEFMNPDPLVFARISRRFRVETLPPLQPVPAPRVECRSPLPCPDCRQKEYITTNEDQKACSHCGRVDREGKRQEEGERRVFEQDSHAVKQSKRNYGRAYNP